MPLLDEVATAAERMREKGEVTAAREELRAKICFGHW